MVCGATTVHEYACDDNDRPIVNAVPFFGMTVGSGEFFTMGEKVGHIGQSAGHDDIKYQGDFCRSPSCRLTS